MLISCPECTTKFSIADAILGDRGRKVRCFKCGHTWHQNPPGMEQETITPQAMPAATAEPVPPRPPTQPLMPPMPTVNMDVQAPSPANMERDVPPAPVVPPEVTTPFPQPSPMPLESAPMDGGFVPPAPPTNVGALPMDSTPVGARKPAVNPSDIPNFDGNLNAAAVAPSSSADLESSSNTVDMDALLDSTAEDIPKVLATRMRKDDKKKGSAFGKFGVLLLILGTVVAGFWFARKEIANRFPQTVQYYKMLSIPIEVLDEGLEFRGVTPEMTKRDGKQVLIVRGVIVNTLPRERSVPLLRLVLQDTNGAMIQEAYAKPRRDTLDAGAQVGFQIVMEDPSAVAARYEVVFAEPPAESAQPEEVNPLPAPDKNHQ